MDPITVIRSEAQRLADVLQTAAPGARCPTCPDWSAADLLWHLTEVHLFWATILREGLTEQDQVQASEKSKPPRPESVESLLELRSRATSDLLEQLVTLSDADHRWSWFPPDQTVGFTRRMQVHEATIHRVDAELTAGVTVSPIAPDVAADGVEHAIDVMWAGAWFWKPDWAEVEPVAVVELAATDTGLSRLVEVGRWSGTSPTSGKDHSEPIARAVTEGTAIASISGPAMDLDLWAWNRGGVVKRSGDQTALAAADAVAQAGMD
ncbi:maleylpyruvate isomerase family mycothiol-dependent enzyme [Mariniluteicoccus flavus]